MDSSDMNTALVEHRIIGLEQVCVELVLLDGVLRLREPLLEGLDLRKMLVALPNAHKVVQFLELLESILEEDLSHHIDPLFSHFLDKFSDIVQIHVAYCEICQG
mmetsp:Transcript_38614/g.36968  ORF Transcript_38614/g.36968 Transcript_38614/m.36968 type:complete len:104 (-) Transcript_38614:587-898(-)